MRFGSWKKQPKEKMDKLVEIYDFDGECAEYEKKYIALQ